MRMPYTRAIQINSAVLSKHLLVEVTNTTNVVSSALTLITNLFSSVALVILMVYVEPFLVLYVMLGISITMGSLFFFTKKGMFNLGAQVEMCNRKIYQAAHEALVGLKDIKCYGVEKYFIQQFLTPLKKNTSLGVYYQLISGFPGIFINVIAFLKK